MKRVLRIKLRIRRFSRRHPWIAFSLRSFTIFSATFGGAYGFIAGSRSENSGYDPNAFAIGASFLFALACVGLATLSMRLRFVHRKLRKIALHNEALADRNWELKEAEERARSLFELQGDLIVLRDAEGCITFVNDAYCDLAQQAPQRADRQPPFSSPCSSRATPRSSRTARGFTIRRSQPRSDRGGSLGAKRWSASMRARRPRCKASAATSPTAPRPNARSPKPATRPMPPTAPSRAFSRWPATKSARR